MTRQSWTSQQALTLLEQPFADLMHQAQTVHRQHFDPNKVELVVIYSIKTGACPEDCKYCAQSVRYNTGLQREPLLDIETILTAARRAKKEGATRFCMGAAWRALPKKQLASMINVIQAVKELGLQTCFTLGMLEAEQAQQLAAAGLDYYNHNLDTSPTYYPNIVTTHSYQDRLNTLKYVRDAGIKVCSGGILGLGEDRADRISLLCQLANLEQAPESVPINHLVPIPGTPLERIEPLSPIEFVRTVATARIMMPRSFIRLAAGRKHMSDEWQSLCYLAGANAVFSGNKLLTVANAALDNDAQLFDMLGIHFY